jgi:hypothetical protein
MALLPLRFIAESRVYRRLLRVGLVSIALLLACSGPGSTTDFASAGSPGVGAAANGGVTSASGGAGTMILGGAMSAAGTASGAGGGPGATGAAGTTGSGGVTGGGTTSSAGTSSAGTSSVGGASAGGTSASAIPTSPILYGENDWINIGANLWPVVKAANVGVVRIGGNAYDTVGGVPNDVGAIHAQGMQVIYQMPYNASADQAKAIVRQFNGNPANPDRASYIKIWEIGNEPDGVIHQNQAQVQAYFSKLAAAMKEADPSILLYGVSCEYYNDAYMNALFGGANDISGKVPGQSYYYVDGIVWHSYMLGSYFGGGGNYDNGESLQLLGKFQKDIDKAKALMTKVNAKRTDSPLTWAIGEMNVSYQATNDESATGYGSSGFAAGQMWANYFSIGMQNRAVYMTPWSIQEGAQLGFLDGAGKPKSTYYHEQMLGAYFTGWYLPSTSSTANVRVIAASDGHTRIAVMVLNQDAKAAYDYTVRLNMDPAPPGARTQLSVDAQLAATYDDHAPPQSTTVVLFDLAGHKTQKLFYSLAQTQQGVGPVVSQ